MPLGSKGLDRVRVWACYRSKIYEFFPTDSVLPEQGGPASVKRWITGSELNPAHRTTSTASKAIGQLAKQANVGGHELLVAQERGSSLYLVPKAGYSA